MRVRFYDTKDAGLYVTKQQGELLKRAISGGAQWVEINECMYAVNSIKTILADLPGNVDTPQLVPGVNEITEEQRQKNIERIRQMKWDFVNKRAGKRQNDAK